MKCAMMSTNTNTLVLQYYSIKDAGSNGGILIDVECYCAMFDDWL